MPCTAFPKSNCTSLITFLSIFSEGVEKCIPWSENITQQIDLAFNIFFMVYFFIRVSILYKQEPVLPTLQIDNPWYNNNSPWIIMDNLRVPKDTKFQRLESLVKYKYSKDFAQSQFLPRFL